MRSSIMATLLCVAFFVPIKAWAQTSVPSTGLGQCVDFIASASSTLTNQANTSGYTYHYGAGSYTDRINLKVFVPTFSCSSNSVPGTYSTVAYLSHELGHVFFDDLYVPVDQGKDVYVNGWCDNEARAVINNITARDEIYNLSLGSADIELAASNDNDLYTIYRSGGTLRYLGAQFCNNNTASTTGQNYRDFYGDYYDTLP